MEEPSHGRAADASHEAEKRRQQCGGIPSRGTQENVSRAGPSASKSAESRAEPLLELRLQPPAGWALAWIRAELERDPSLALGRGMLGTTVKPLRPLDVPWCTSETQQV